MHAGDRSEEATGSKTAPPGPSAVIYERTLLNLAGSPTILSDGLDDKRGCAWLAAHTICCITSGLQKTFGASHSDVTFRTRVVALARAAAAWFFVLFSYRTLWIYRGWGEIYVHHCFFFTRSWSHLGFRRSTHSPYTPWQRMPSTISASSPQTQIIRSILFFSR